MCLKSSLFFSAFISFPSFAHHVLALNSCSCYCSHSHIDSVLHKTMFLSWQWNGFFHFLANFCEPWGLQFAMNGCHARTGYL